MGLDSVDAAVVTETSVVISSCCRRVSGSSGDISTPKVAKAWWSASGIRLCDATIWLVPPSVVGCTGVAYSIG